jgi:hypothetical protein
MFEDANSITYVEPVDGRLTKKTGEKISPFDFVKSITETKEDLLTGNESSYNQFMINKALSFMPDCVFHVHQLCMADDMPDSAHYNYLINTISRKKRYGGWAKKDTLPATVDLLKEAFGYSTKDALAASELLSDKQLLQLQDEMRKGGRK